MENINQTTANKLKSFIERVEKLEEDKSVVGEDIKEVYSEMKSEGFDTKTVRKIIRLRKKSKQDREQEEMILDTYLQALGQQ